MKDDSKWDKLFQLSEEYASTRRYQFLKRRRLMKEISREWKAVVDNGTSPEAPPASSGE